jgi:hypothetical protein
VAKTCLLCTNMLADIRLLLINSSCGTAEVYIILTTGYQSNKSSQEPAFSSAEPGHTLTSYFPKYQP